MVTVVFFLILFSVRDNIERALQTSGRSAEPENNDGESADTSTRSRSLPETRDQSENAGSKSAESSSRQSGPPIAMSERKYSGPLVNGPSVYGNIQLTDLQ